MPTSTIEPTISGQLLDGLIALREGDFSHRLPTDLIGVDGKLADTFNDVIAMNQRMAAGARAHQPGWSARQGRLSARASVGDVQRVLGRLD